MASEREDVLSPVRSTQDEVFEESIRPQTLAEFIGQKVLKERLYIFLEAARRRKEALDHTLFYGPPGLGKTTLAHIIAKEMGVNIIKTTGPTLEKAGDLAGVLTNLTEGDILFIDEIHRLPRNVEEYLYPAMEDYEINILIDTGPAARAIKLDLARFTLVGATTRAGLITSPLRSRFGVVERIDYYDPPELLKIVMRSARILKIPVDEKGADMLSKRSRGTPRISNRLLKRVRDYAEVKSDGIITEETATEALKLLEVDEHGLDEMDKRIILAILEKYDGGPVGLKTLALAVGEEEGTIEEIYEPYLVKEGFITRTQRGRIVTPMAYRYFGFKKPGNENLTLGLD
ncbi:Holliday junction branch migration DNA helicase RuvB [bacterium]|nr:Holliday junction branch migration DNA helicase RuvB [bacterium]